MAAGGVELCVADAVAEEDKLAVSAVMLSLLVDDRVAEMEMVAVAVVDDSEAV